MGNNSESGDLEVTAVGALSQGTAYGAADYAEGPNIVTTGADLVGNGSDLEDSVGNYEDKAIIYTAGGHL